MNPHSDDYKFIQKLLLIGKYCGILQLKSKLSYILKIIIILLASGMLYLCYYSISMYWKLQKIATNRFMFIFWYILQLMFVYTIFLKLFKNQTKWQTLLKEINQIEYISNQCGYTMKAMNWKIIFDLLLSYSVIALEFLEWITGSVDLLSQITFLQWKITTCYMCYLFITVKTIAAFLQRRYNFINQYLEKTMRENIFQVKNVIFHIDRAGNLMIDIQQFLETFNQVFGFDLFFYLNVVIVFSVNTAIFAFKRLEQSIWDGSDDEQVIFFECFLLYYIVSIEE